MLGNFFYPFNSLAYAGRGHSGEDPDVSHQNGSGSGHFSPDPEIFHCIRFLPWHQVV